MRAPRDSDSEQCNNIQYMPNDEGFYPKCLTVLQLHTYFRKGGPMGTKPLILTMTALRQELHRKHRPWQSHRGNRIISHVW